MSTNEIDVNAVNKRTAGSTEEVVVAKNTGKKNDAWSVDDEHLRQMSSFIKYNFQGRYLYRKMMTLMFFESVAWTILDALRSARMRTAEKISQAKLKK